MVTSRGSGINNVMGIFDEVKEEVSGEHSLLKGVATGNWGAVKGYAKEHPVRTTVILGTMLNHEEEDEDDEYDAASIRRVKVANAKFEEMMLKFFVIFICVGLPIRFIIWLLFE